MKLLLLSATVAAGLISSSSFRGTTELQKENYFLKATDHLASTHIDSLPRKSNRIHEDSARFEKGLKNQIENNKLEFRGKCPKPRVY